MKKIVLTAVFMVFGGIAAMAQTTEASPALEPIAAAVPTPAGPSIQFEDQKFDFGQIKAGEVVEHTYKFTNNGSLPLIIYKVRTTCGCTATNFPEAPVMPGHTASITARFNSTGKRGKQNKVLVVESNAVQGNAQVILSTTVVPEN